MFEHFNDYSGSAEGYIREYLDPDATLDKSPTSESEARELWRSLEENFSQEGGTGIDECVFVDAVRKIQERNGFPKW